jgi:hypothetical protein
MRSIEYTFTKLAVQCSHSNRRLSHDTLLWWGWRIASARTRGRWWVHTSITRRWVCAGRRATCGHRLPVPTALTTVGDWLHMPTVVVVCGRSRICVCWLAIRGCNLWWLLLCSCGSGCCPLLLLLVLLPKDEPTHATAAAAAKEKPPTESRGPGRARFECVRGSVVVIPNAFALFVLCSARVRMHRRVRSSDGAGHGVSRCMTSQKTAGA